MKVYGLNGREYKISLNKYLGCGDTGKSKYHILARGLINEIFNGFMVLEEVKLPGIKAPGVKSSLFLDFFIPNMKIGVEIHGEQHYNYIPFFHKTVSGFYDSKKRDALKIEWCELNSLELIELKYSDSISVWKKQLERT
jgi:hypothetical protein